MKKRLFAMLLALGMAHAQQAMDAQRAVTDMTNQLLRKNAEALKQGTIAAAKESEPVQPASPS